ncbi:hypothetical protein [Kineosporia sp. NBRC 101731]|uniref:hypothetical protein n=1 Tax=Kineosporia sp. NBRC 101731 TaxID=3032199 RepID=UPI0024A0D7FB|nr:hypothetical protein [Kineosporia sp. NBRC 101731]GLY30590.1 hypothetical protein Kisp02_39550 [Kineosporia sp. NBRC 101731]
MLANRTARWSFGTAAICVVLLLLGWFLLIAPRRSDTTALRDQATQSDSQASLLQIKIAQLESQAADLPAQKAKLAEITQQLTPGAGIPEFVRTLQSIEAQSGVDLSTITPGAPVVATASDTATSTTAATTTTATAGTLVAIPMGLSLSGDYYETVQFLRLLQTKIDRTYLITALALSEQSTTATESAAADGTSLSGASISEAATTAATNTPTATSKGNEGGTATSDATPTTGATSGTGSGTDATATDAAVATDEASLSITGQIYVLLDGSSSLEDVKKDAADAAVGSAATPTTSATATAQTAITSP